MHRRPPGSSLPYDLTTVLRVILVQDALAVGNDGQDLDANLVGSESEKTVTAVDSTPAVNLLTPVFVANARVELEATEEFGNHDVTLSGPVSQDVQQAEATTLNGKLNDSRDTFTIDLTPAFNPLTPDSIPGASVDATENLDTESNLVRRPRRRRGRGRGRGLQNAQTSEDAVDIQNHTGSPFTPAILPNTITSAGGLNPLAPVFAPQPHLLPTIAGTSFWQLAPPLAVTIAPVPKRKRRRGRRLGAALTAEPSEGVGEASDAEEGHFVA